MPSFHSSIERDKREEEVRGEVAGKERREVRKKRVEKRHKRKRDKVDEKEK